MSRVPFPVICAVKAHEPFAVAYVFSHFAGYIAALTYSDDELRYQATLSLYNAVSHFRFHDPPDDFSI